MDTKQRIDNAKEKLNGLIESLAPYEKALQQIHDTYSLVTSNTRLIESAKESKRKLDTATEQYWEQERANKRRIYSLTGSLARLEREHESLNELLSLLLEDIGCLRRKRNKRSRK